MLFISIVFTASDSFHRKIATGPHGTLTKLEPAARVNQPEFARRDSPEIRRIDETDSAVRDGDRDLVGLVNDISNGGSAIMSPRCSICRHPKLDRINVSLLRDGTRSTVREFKISRSALDRHKHHLTDTVELKVDGSAEYRAGPTPAEPLSNAQGDPVAGELLLRP